MARGSSPLRWPGRPRLGAWQLEQNLGRGDHFRLPAAATQDDPHAGHDTRVNPDGQIPRQPEEAAEEQHRLLLQTRPRLLDDAIVDRVDRVYTEKVDLLAIYHEQLDWWCSGP